jgi:galactosamine-6-phosphate isomerase
MTIHYLPSYSAMSQKAADIVLPLIEAKPNLLFCAASGGSPTGFYAELAKKHQEEPEFFSQLRVVKLDEWGGLKQGSTFTSEYDVQQKFLKPLEIGEDRYLSIDAFTSDPETECKKIQGLLEINGPVDVCILGIGVNGHIALNEPAENLELGVHVAELAPSTLANGMIKTIDQPPTFGMTLGIGNIMDSKKIILFISGSGKKEAFQKLVSGKVSSHFPASLLWLHPNVEVLVDESAVV